MTGLLKKIETSDSSTKMRKPYNGVSLVFSNTGKRSNGWFVLTGEMLLQGLKDILLNIEDFHTTYLTDGGRYIESSWRELFARTFQDPAMQTIGRVQTFPVFSIIAKIIHFSNTNMPYRDRYIDIDEDWIRQAIHEFSRACDIT